MEILINLESASLQKKYYYGLQFRPYSIGAQPKGPIQFIEPDDIPIKFRDVDKRKLRHGILVYPNKLSDRDVSQYQLVDLNLPSPREQWARFKEFAQDMVEYEIDYDEFVKDFIHPRGQLRDRNPLHQMKPVDFLNLSKRMATEEILTD